MPTFATTPRFKADWKKLSREQRQRFEKIVREAFVPDVDASSFRSGLRVRGIQGHPGVFEMTWAPDGRATWEYGEEVRQGEPHVVWRRIGTHKIFDPGPP